MKKGKISISDLKVSSFVTTANGTGINGGGKLTADARYCTENGTFCTPCEVSETNGEDVCICY